jgi:hypothetical protein
LIAEINNRTAQAGKQGSKKTHEVPKRKEAFRFKCWAKSVFVFSGTVFIILDIVYPHPGMEMTKQRKLKNY